MKNTMKNLKKKFKMTKRQKQEFKSHAIYMLIMASIGIVGGVFMGSLVSKLVS
jgi:Mg2+/citrate symporter